MNLNLNPNLIPNLNPNLSLDLNCNPNLNPNLNLAYDLCLIILSLVKTYKYGTQYKSFLCIFAVSKNYLSLPLVDNIKLKI